LGEFDDAKDLMSTYKLSNFLPLISYGASLEDLVVHKDSFSVFFCVIERTKKKKRHVILKAIFYVVLLRSLCWFIICGNHASPYFISSCPKDIKSLALPICGKVKCSLLKHFFTLFEH